ncbi:MAG: carbohydrate binding domain-containing protein [Candidatus Dormibacteria bacterium]
MPALKLRRMSARAFCLLTAVTVTSTAGLSAGMHPARAAAPPSVVQVTPEVHHDTSPPLSSIPPAQVQNTIDGKVFRSQPLGHGPDSGSGGNLAPQGGSPDTSGTVPGRNLPTASANFNGVVNDPSGVVPPDNEVAAGATQVFQLVNSQFEIFSKSGAVVLSNRNTNTIWSGFGGGCQTNDDGDGTVLWDTQSSRWVVQQFSVSTTPYLDCVAISTGADATGSYNRYSFSYSNFPDYPKMGVWPDAYYISYNMFNSLNQFAGSSICAYQRSAMLTGATATQQCFTVNTSYFSLQPATIDGATAPAAGTPEWFVSLSANPNALSWWKYHVDWTTPTNSSVTGPTDLAVSAFSEACGGGTCVPQSGTSQQLDSLADRMMYRLAYRNFGDHEAMVISHAVTSGSSVGMRWYELRPSGGSLTLFQQGTYAPDSSYRWMGSIAQDRSGDMALGYSISSASTFPSLAWTGRLAGDAAGTMPQGESTIFTGSGSQTGYSRWGDYSEMSIDPADDCTFWYTNEYLPGTGSFNWNTRIASFRFSQCGGTVSNDFSISASPSSVTVTQGSGANSTISTAITSGSAQSVTLSASGLPSGATASFNPNPINSGASSTLTLATASTTPVGTYTVTVTGTGASATHTTTVTLTVNAPVTNDFSISASPSSVTVTQGSGANSTISTAVISGSAQSVTLSASGLPSGAGASFSPNPINSGSSSTLALSTASTTPAGTYTVTVTGTGASATHTTTLSLTVNGAGGGPVVTNGGFETGNFSGWTTGGLQAPTVVSGGAHSGTYSARLGNGQPYNGDSFIQQTVAVPSGSSTLTFWYQPHCPDTITYDQETMQVRSTGGTVLATPLNVCSNSGAWTQVSFDMTPYASTSVVLYFNSHDDGYSGDPTYTFFDDVSVASVPPPPPNVVQNPGFETGNFTSWTTGGLQAPTVVSGGAHSGTYSARLGNGQAYNGDSFIQQAITVPSGSPNLTFWYQPHCPDTIAYDQETMQIRNTSGTVLATVLNVCSNSGAWTKVTYSMSAYAGQTVVLYFNSHDDGYASDPTYTFFDDVSVQ